MTEYHPDKMRHHGQNKNQDNDNAQDKVLITAETITHAYETLRLPHTRACYLLGLLNCPLTEYDNDNDGSGNSSQSQQQQQLVGMDFLMDMMEWRERIENVVTETTDDATSTSSQQKKKEELRVISEETSLLQNQCKQSLERLLDLNDDKNGYCVYDDDTLQEARKLTAQLQYWYRLECALREEMD